MVVRGDATPTDEDLDKSMWPTIAHLRSIGHGNAVEEYLGRHRGLNIKPIKFRHAPQGIGVHHFDPPG